MAELSIKINIQDNTAYVSNTDATAVTNNAAIIQCENLGSNVDVLNTTSSSTETIEKNTLRTENEVKSTLEPLANKYGLRTDDIIEIIKKMTNKSLEDLLNLLIEYDQKLKLEKLAEVK